MTDPTRDDVLKEPAGPRLDGWVSAAMGVVPVGEAPCWRHDGYWSIRHWAIGNETDGLRPVVRDDGIDPDYVPPTGNYPPVGGVSSYHLRPVPAYSTDSEELVTLLDWMAGAVPDGSCGVILQGQRDVGWICRVFGEGRSPWAEGITPQLAACRAAALFGLKL